MRHYRNFTSVLTVLLLVGIGAGCENAPQIAGPADQAPQFAPGNGNGRPSTTSTPVVWADGVTGALATANLSSGGGTLAITDEDGSVIVALYVPGGAAPGGLTEFTMELACDENRVCEVLLSAARNGSDTSNFRKDVELHINLDYLSPPKDASITIAESHGDGSYTPVPTRQDGDFLIATINHFSAYVPITD